MKTLSIIIPVYNEEETIDVLITKVKNIKTALKKEIVVVNDGSKDKSLEILKKINGIKLLSHDKNKGKGASLITGLKNCTGDIIAIQDADLEYDPEQIPGLIKPILENETEIVYGSRFLGKNNQNWKIPLHYIANVILSFLATLLYGCKITDVETCYKVFTKKVKNSIDLESNDFGFEIEFTAKVCKNGFKIKEIPINYTPRLWNEGKKINWRDGVKAFWYLLKYRFDYSLMEIKIGPMFLNPRIILLSGLFLLSLAWRPLLVFVIPGILILFIPNYKEVDLIDLLIYIVGLSLAFWITAFWFLKYIPISLTGFFITITALTILLSVYLILRNKTSYKISLRYYNFLLIAIFLFFIFLRLIPYFTLIAPAGADMSMHTYTTELIVRADGVPKNYRPILAIDTFNAFPQGFRTISAIISLLGKVPAYRATFILTCLTYFFLTAFLFLFLKKYASWQFSFISATAFSFFTVNPQGFASWGGNPTIFALVFLILFLVFLDRTHDNKFFILFASFALAATFLTHAIIFVSAAYIVGFSYLVYFLLNKEYRNYKFLNYFAILAIFFILCLPFLININLKEITPEILNWIKNWVRNTDSDWRGTILNSIYTIPTYLKERVFGTHLFQYTLLICLLGLIIMFFKYFKKALMYFIFLVLCTVLVLNTQYWVLPLSYLIYPERIAVFIIIPMSIFFAFGLEQSFLYLEQKNLNKKILSSLLVLGFISTIAATIFFNKQNYVAGITSQTAITKEDMSAMAWLEKNTGQNDIIENNYGDAGLWISAITFRPTVTVHAELIFLNKNIQLGNPGYVYVGKKCVYDCLIKNDFLSKNLNYKMVYDKDGVYIYKIINKPGT